MIKKGDSAENSVEKFQAEIKKQVYGIGTAEQKCGLYSKTLHTNECHVSGYIQCTEKVVFLSKNMT